MNDMDLIGEMLDPFLTAHEARQCVPNNKAAFGPFSDFGRSQKRPGAKTAGKDVRTSRKKNACNREFSLGMN